MSETPFSLHYQAPDNGPWRGWRITFTLTKFSHGLVPSVLAENGKAKTRDVHEISAILPRDMWPEFAQCLYRQRVGKGHTDDERLF